MESLAAVLFETRHFTVLNPRFGPSVLNTGNRLNAGFLNPGSALLALPAPALNAGSGLLALPAPPAWMLALEHDRETVGLCTPGYRNLVFVAGRSQFGVYRIPSIRLGRRLRSPLLIVHLQPLLHEHLKRVKPVR